MCARGRRPAREPSAPRASLGASSRSPARPRRRPRAPQPGPATAHGRRSQALRTLRHPPHQWGWGADVWLCVSSRSLARPRRRPRAPQPGPAFCSSPVPSGPSGALRTSGAWCAGVWLGASPRSLARPRRRPRAPQPGHPDPPAPSAPVVPGRCCLVRRVLLQTSSIRAAFCADFPALVTNVVNPTAFLRKIVVFGLRLTTFVTRFLTEGFKMRQFDDVCNASLPSAVSPCPVGDAVAADWGGSGGFAALGAGCRRVAGVSHL